MNTNITHHEHEWTPNGNGREVCVCGAWRELVQVGHAQTWITQTATYEVEANHVRSK